MSQVPPEDWAIERAEKYLSPLGSRWLHVQGVIVRSQELQQLFDREARALLITAAALHDIGYAPALAKSGFHPLDGAWYLRKHGYERLACLVAHHSEACFEAELRHLSEELAAFPREHSAIADALNYCDQLTSPCGTPTTLLERKADILARYGESHVVSVAYQRALPYLALAIGRTQQRLAMLPSLPIN